MTTKLDSTAGSRLNCSDLFSPFAGEDGYFILCVEGGKIVSRPLDENDYTEYHIEKLGGDEWRIECSDAAELCEFVYQGRIPDRAFFVALMNNQSTPLPESWENVEQSGGEAAHNPKQPNQ